jgi:hypothetical protein
MNMIDHFKNRFGFKNITAEMALYYVYKSTRQALIYDSSVEKVLCPIFACQRSGTSLMLRVFFWDKDNVVYREGSSLSTNDPLHLRLDSLELVAQRLRDNRAPLVVLKPLVESQNALKIMEALPEARPIWLYRNYLDVVASNLRKFGERNGIDDIRPIAHEIADNWRSDNVSDYTRSIIQRYFAEDMSIYDAAALFWFARNQLFFEQKLETNPRMRLIRYRDFVTKPAQTMREIYAHLERPYPGDGILREVHDESLGRGSTVELSPEIEKLCQDMFSRLNELRESLVV